MIPEEKFVFILIAFSKINCINFKPHIGVSMYWYGFECMVQILTEFIAALSFIHTISNSIQSS